MDLLKSPVRVAVLALLLAGTLFVGGSLQPRHNAQAATAATLAIDADPTNGSGACNPVDATRTVSSGVAFSVALCIQDAGLTPVNGGFNTATIDVAYTGISATNVAPNLGTDLNGNPDWNDVGLAAQSWDCNLAGSAGAAPKASPSPAKIVCSTTSAADQPVTGNVLMATLNFDACVACSVDAVLTWGAGTTSILAGVVEAFCGAEIECIGATVTVGGGGAAPTPTNTTVPPTPASTSTPCVVDGATCTPAAQIKHTVTPTPTSASSATPPPTDTPVSGEIAQPPAPPAPASAPRGTIRLPDTGSGREGRDSWQVALAVLAAAGALGISGGTYARTRSHGRRN